ncbi:Pyridoxal-5'-phosphate-dependent protein beta subunit [Streptomyces bingchenggensis BCW-1]|uniref:Pyridoxal-5'-phosphate-dependent protein beta subunit n=1 Tax=Streptomyces bingchenggensis (strain BCW-1) TaxID=749414 RepID=D7CCZ9_STRBB|nr:Pyridoxal-5'-phosphate-dependent protein beta subunit [Streptomyces bingchenggensis BCW-1]
MHPESNHPEPAPAAEPHYLDERSGARYPLTDPRWCGDDGAPLTVSPLPGITRDDVDTGTRSLWRYRAALPVDIAAPVSLGEGCTPLVEKVWGEVPVRFKLEWFSPTGSFKDRGTSVMISLLAQRGVPEVIEDSSGNGGASVAAYCAAAGIRATILAPEATSPAKVLQSRAYGARVELVPGDRDATAAEALRRSERTYYASHNWHPFFLQGTKTLAYELWEDLGFAAPDNVVTVAGAGSTVLGCDIGFSELLASGQIRRRPRLLVAQPANCAPIHAAFHAQGPAPFAPTVAEGTAIREPIRLPEVVQAVRRSDGDMAAIPEDEIATAVRRLAAMGLYAEPTSATAAAAIDVFRARGAIRPGETTVVLLTGSGLKAATAMNALFTDQGFTDQGFTDQGFADQGGRP